MFPGCIFTGTYYFEFICHSSVLLSSYFVNPVCDPPPQPPPPLVCMWLVYVWSAQRAPGHVPSAAGAERPHTPSEAFALSLLALVLLYFSSVVLFSFSTLPLYSEDRLEVARMQGLGEPTALHKFGSCNSINCLDSKS